MGRPKKVDVAAIVDNVVKRPRGRPRKVQLADIQVGAQEVKKPRGRPRKIQIEEVIKEVKAAPKKIGRPRKIQAPVAASNGNGNGRAGDYQFAIHSNGTQVFRHHEEEVREYVTGLSPEARETVSVFQRVPVTIETTVKIGD